MRTVLLMAGLATLLSVGCGDDDGGTDGSGGTGAAGGANTSAVTATSTTAATTGQGGSSGDGGSGGNNTGGNAAGGMANCTDVTVGAFILDDTEMGGSSIAFTLDGLDPNEENAIYIEFYVGNGAQTPGMYDLTAPPDNNYQSCTHCVLAFSDAGGAATPYFPISGVMNVTTADTVFTAKSAGQFIDVVLGEVTLNGTVTTPVPGGRCLRLSGGWDTSSN